MREEVGEREMERDYKREGDEGQGTGGWERDIQVVEQVGRRGNTCSESSLPIESMCRTNREVLKQGWLNIKS